MKLAYILWSIVSIKDTDMFVLLYFRFAFQYNPALQPRAIIVFGCISKSVTDSEIKQMLKILMKVPVFHLFLTFQ